MLRSADLSLLLFGRSYQGLVAGAIAPARQLVGSARPATNRGPGSLASRSNQTAAEEHALDWDPLRLAKGERSAVLLGCAHQPSVR